MRLAPELPGALVFMRSAPRFPRSSAALNRLLFIPGATARVRTEQRRRRCHLRLGFDQNEREQTAEASVCGRTEATFIPQAALRAAQL